MPFEHDTFFPTEQGVCQGAVLSPLLANIALHGLEQVVRKALSPVRVQVIRYADDLGILTKSREGIEHCKETVQTWLTTVGLTLHPKKTRLAHTLEPIDGRAGFDFLGGHIRQYRVGKYRAKRGFTTRITPAQAAIRRHYRKLAALVEAHRALPQAAVIEALNPRLRGWSAYYAPQVSSATFVRLDALLYQKLQRWGRARHTAKSRTGMSQRYWRRQGTRKWVFATAHGPRLRSHAETPMVRHVKVRAAASWYDGHWSYWATRHGRHPETPRRLAKLLKRQGGRCTECQLSLTAEDRREIHHRDGQRTNNRYANLTVVHGHCHDHLHGSRIPDKNQAVEERSASQEARSVLEQR